MSDIISLQDAREKRDGPDPEFCRTDDFGRRMFTYLLSYDMEGSQWSIEVVAYSLEDAAARVAAMRSSLRLDGQVFGAGIL